MTDLLEPKPELVEFLAAAFGLHPCSGGDIRPVARGAMGQIYRLTLGEGDYAVKHFYWDMDENAARNEGNFRDAAVAAGVRAPANFTTVDGRYLCRLPDSLGGRMARLYGWVDGDPVDVRRSASALGDLLGRLHSLSLPVTGPVHPWYEVVPVEEEWAEIVRAALDARLSWADPLRRRLPVISELAELVSPVSEEERIICHLDVQPMNVLSDDHGLLLLDWDDAGAGSAERELASTLMRWYVAGSMIHGEEAARMLDAYHAAGGRVSLTGERSFAMNAATHLNYIAAQARLILDDQAAAHRQEAERQLRDALTHLPTRELYRKLLDVAATTPRRTGGRR
ncbi:aminoglycoside phosphotransferase family protein [Nonomuraea sp. MG754425]|uniref:phosphotransferase enzyme family protein n=1 Tax=Nonomuraea sp. MG754425 TaxID=2570319 RepID=UPI001F32BE6E|nr:aminoglycoside phosphotransferase family protein [Nonomuraea sp. MG754425]MCF6473394.1 aminoglycoside phosphotransferase family protein [Nonomuraea sp. MG754425]